MNQDLKTAIEQIKALKGIEVQNKNKYEQLLEQAEAMAKVLDIASQRRMVIRENKVEHYVGEALVAAHTLRDCSIKLSPEIKQILVAFEHFKAERGL